jgi:proline dehydrogenase
MTLARTLLLRASESPTLRRQIQDRRFARRAVRRFMPGESLEDALSAAADLERAGLSTTLTRLGENLRDAAEMDAVAAHYVDVVRSVAERGLDCEVSVKLTHLGLDDGTDEPRRRVGAIAGAAAAHGARIWIDMEGSAYLERTLRVYRELLAVHRNVGLCLQAYLRRTPEDLEALLPLGAAIRLVKGAYQESAAIAFARKRDVDDAYFRLATRLLRDTAAGGSRHVVATHDLRLVRLVRAAAGAIELPAEQVEFAMLYGIQSAAQRQLAAEGCRVRVLISYGDGWYPWFMRRLAERPANVLFVLRNLVG